MKNRIQELLLNRKEKLEGKIKEIPKISFKKCAFIFLGYSAINMISNTLGAITCLGLMAYACKNYLLPLERKLELKLINKLTATEIKSDKSSVLGKIKSKIIGLSNNKKAKNAKLEKGIDSTKKTAKGVTRANGVARKIYNLSVSSVKNFKRKMAIKKDILGVKIVSGSYHLKCGQIIQDSINLKEIKKFIENSKIEKERVKVKV